MTVLSTIPASTGMIVLFRTVLFVQARIHYMHVYSASGLKSKLFVFSVLWHILLSISSIKCHKRARFGENVAELLLIPYICINHIENNFTLNVKTTEGPPL